MYVYIANVHCLGSCLCSSATFVRNFIYEYPRAHARRIQMFECVYLPCFWLFYFTIDPNCERALRIITTKIHTQSWLGVCAGVYFSECASEAHANVAVNDVSGSRRRRFSCGWQAAGGRRRPWKKARKEGEYKVKQRPRPKRQAAKNSLFVCLCHSVCVCQCVCKHFEKWLRKTKAQTETKS